MGYKLVGGLAAIAAAFAVLAACSTGDGGPGERVGTQRQNLVQVPVNQGIKTIAGGTTPGNGGDGGPASAAQLNDPAGVAVADDGTIYIADWGNNSVRRINATTGIIDGFVQGRPNLIKNPRAEKVPMGAPGIEDWVRDAAPWVPTRKEGCSTTACGHAYDGSRWFWSGPVASGELTQTIPLSAADVTLIQQGGVKGHFHVQMRTHGGDRARTRVEYRNASDAVVASFDTLPQSPTVWTAYSADTNLPTTVRKIVVKLIATAASDGSADAYFDGLQLRLLNGAPVTVDDGLTALSAVAVSGNSLLVGANDFVVFDRTTGNRTFTYPVPRRVSHIAKTAVTDGTTYIVDPTHPRLYVLSPTNGAYEAEVTGLPNEEPLGVAAIPLNATTDRLWITFRAYNSVYMFDCPKAGGGGTVVTCTHQSSGRLGSNKSFVDDVDGTAGGEKFNLPHAVTLGKFGDLLIADEGNHALRRALKPLTLTAAGNGNPGFVDNVPSNQSQLTGPGSAAAHPDGSILVPDRVNNRIRKITCGASNVCQATAGTACPLYPLNDNNACTTDSCLVLGVKRQEAAAGTSCSDNNACNGAETCNATGQCVAGTPLTGSNDNNPCTADYCDPVSGNVNVALAAGTPCSTGDPCKTMGTCSGATKICQGVVNISVDDGNICTTDSCSAGAGVVHTPVAGTVPCGFSGTCSAGVCADSGTTLGAPALDQLLPKTPNDLFSHLLTDGNQPGADTTKIDANRVALIRGQVKNASDAALSGVTVSVPGRPEFGSTTTNASGDFFLVVNGGGPLSVRFSRANYLSADRQVQPEWGATVGIYDVTLIQPAANPTSVTIGAGTPSTLAFTPLVTETVGGSSVSHRTSVYFPPGTVSGSLTNLQFQATEYTQGANGARRMPADIATNTVYMYASEFSIASGTEAVEFQKPVFAYVDNFLGYPPGAIVPAGYYDRDARVWKPEPSGCVVKIASNNRVAVTLETQCDAHFASLGADYAITADEKQRLAQAAPPEHASGYPVGKTLWRVPLKHFSPHDFNSAVRPPKCEKVSAPGTACEATMSGGDCVCPDGDGTVKGDDEPEGGSCQLDGSIIEADGQILGERLPVGGTPFTLNYRSNRVPGHLWGRTVELNFDGPKHSQVSGYKVRLSVAGTVKEFSFSKNVSGPQYVSWDGLDHAGREVVGAQKAMVEIGTVYPVVASGGDGQRFMQFPVGNVVQMPGERAQQREIVIWQKYYRTLQRLDASDLGLGGWTLSAYHQYDPTTKLLHLGDGSRRTIADADVVQLVAGSGQGGGISVDGTPAEQAVFPEFQDFAVSATGELYFSFMSPSVVQKIGLDGKIKRVAGSPVGSGSLWTDGAVATSVQLNDSNTYNGRFVRGIALAGDGTLYLTDGKGRLYRVDPAGNMWLVAGSTSLMASTHAECAAAENVTARGAHLCNPSTVAVAPDGSVYVNSRSALGYLTIKRIEPGATNPTSDARITTVAGGGLIQNPEDVTPDTRATQLHLFGPDDFAFAVGPDGSLYFAQNDIYRLYPDGRLQLLPRYSPIAPCRIGTGTAGFRFTAMEDLSVAPDGALIFHGGQIGVIGQNCDHRIWRLDAQNNVQSLVGNGTSPDTSVTPPLRPTLPNVLSAQTPIWYEKTAVAPNGTVYFASKTARRIFKSGRPNPAPEQGCDLTLPSEDGSEFYCFTAQGRHLKTLDTRTKAVIYTFNHTQGGLLDSITHNAAGNIVTDIQPGTNKVTIRSHYGQATEITLHATTKFATNIKDANLQSIVVAHNAQGLLTSFRPPEATTPYTFGYDGYGRLQSDSDPEGGRQSFDRSLVGDGTKVTRTTLLGSTTSYQLEIDPESRRELRTITRPDGLKNTSEALNRVTTGNGRETLTRLADGTEITTIEDIDKRWGTLAPTVAQTSTKVPTTPTPLTLTVKQDKCYQEGATCPQDPTSGGAGTFTESEMLTVNGTRKYFRTYTGGSTRTITETTPMGRVTKYVLDDKGRLVSIQAPGDTTTSNIAVGLTYVNDKLHTMTQGTRLVTLGYYGGTTGGVSGHLASVLDPGINPKTTEINGIDAMGRPTIIERLDVPTVLSWDSAGRLTGVTPPGQPLHDLDYTQAGQIKTYTPPALPGLSTASTWVYNKDRDLEVVQVPGTSIDLLYDGSLGRLKEVRTPTDSATFAYYPDCNGAACAPGEAPGTLKTATASGSGNVLTFRHAGALPTSISQTVKTTSSTDTIATTWTYDSNLWPTTEKVQKGSGASTTVTYAFDNDAVLTCASLGTTATPCSETTKAYKVTPWDKSARPKTITLNTIVEKPTFNAMGELASQVVTKANNAALMSIVYEPSGLPRDAFGRVADRDETVNGVSKSIHYEYDDFGRLLEVLADDVVVGHYEYDANGNRADGTFWINGAGQTVEGTFLYDDQDRLISFTSSGQTPSTSYEYDARGALSRKHGPAFDYRYQYDATGGLRSATTDAGLIEYTLDAFGRRIGRKKNGTLERQWVYEKGLAPVAELDSAGTITKRFVYATGRNVPDFLVTPADNIIYRILTDQLGSVRLVVNSSTGAIKQELDYDAFGNVLKNVGTDAQFVPFGFAGGLYDPDTQLVRFGARDYDPSVGRWVNKDPILFAGRQSNLYAYVGNDPVNVIDPEGLVGDYVGWTVYGGSPFLPWVAGLFGYTLPATVGVSVGIFKDVDFSTGDVSLGFYFTKSWTVDLPTAPIICNAGTEFGLQRGLSGFKGKSEGVIADIGPFAASGSWAPGSSYLHSLPSSVGGNVSVGPGAFAGWTNSDTSIAGVSGGPGGFKTIR